MTTTRVLSTIALHEEWKGYCKGEGLPCISACELIHNERLTPRQQQYIRGFIVRWDEAEARDNAHPTLQPHRTIYRGLEIDGYAYEPAATEKELETYRRQMKLDVERRNRGLHPRDIGLVMTGEQA